MVTFPLRRIIVVAVLASLPRIASAQGDGALSSAFAAMRAPLAAMAQLKAAPQAPAPRAPGPTVPADLWLKMRRMAIIMGKDEPIPGTATARFYTYKKTAHPAAGEITINTIALSGVPLADGSIRTGVAIISRMETKLLPGNTEPTWEQWNFLVSKEGQLQKAERKRGILRGGKPAEDTTVEMDLADPEVKSSFDRMLLYWSPFAH